MTFKQRLALIYVRTKFTLLSSLSKRKAAASALDLFRTPQTRNTKLPSQIFDKAQKLQFDIEGTTVHGYSWNHNVLKKILIIHGFESSIVNFDHFVFPLMDKGYGVLAFDAPAHGDSSGTTVNAIAYSNMIKKVIELYGPVESFIAHSFGGIALSLAMEDIPHDANSKIVFIAPATETTSAVDGAFAMLKIKDAAVRKAFDQVIFEISGKPTEWFSIRRAVKNISAKILWVHDEDDDVTPLSDALKVKADAHSHIQFIITKGLGHRRIYHDAAVKKAIENFL